ncbi:MAG: hypothetical protein ACK6A8_17215 [Planctomycetota bacterium]|jgi:hypothetical protein
MTLNETIANLQRDWANPRRTSDSAPNAPDLKVACSFEEGHLANVPHNTPVDLEIFWKNYKSARLFEDRQFGQWGLEILDPSESRLATSEYDLDRERDRRFGDRVIGRFFGDSEVLLIRCDPSAPDYGCIIVALPLDSRKDWPLVGNSFSEFFERYAKGEGAKFWE